MSNMPVSINLVVMNGEKYIRYFLNSILSQTYVPSLIEVNIWDNSSNDETKNIIKEMETQFSSFYKFTLFESNKNLGMWVGQEELFKHSSGKYVVAAAVDIILDENFIKNSVEIMEKDYKIGTLQAKVYKYDINNGHINLTDTIDTCGFEIKRSRKVINIGHGEKDNGQFTKEKEIFGVEGAIPVFRRTTLTDISINESFADHDFFWYGDDFDIAWRIRLFGWKEIFAPSVIAWHDRQTTKNLSKGGTDYLKRIGQRKQIPLKKRRLDWRNLRFTIIKNDYIINILKDLPSVVFRELAILGYTLIVEPGVFLEYPKFFGLLPKMLSKRKQVMAKAKVTPREIHKWFK